MPWAGRRNRVGLKGRAFRRAVVASLGGWASAAGGSRIFTGGKRGPGRLNSLLRNSKTHIPHRLRSVRDDKECRACNGAPEGAPLQFVFLLALLFACCPSLQSAEAPSNTFLIVSDIHFNPMADPALVADLNAADPTQWETILERSKLTRFSQYGEDTNWWLLRSALDQMRLTLPHPAFIMVPGDFLAHDFPANYAAVTHDNDREHYRVFVLKTLGFLALEFRKRFGDTKILVTPGNNDEECGDNSMQAHGEFLNDTAELARETVEADRGFKKEWKAMGIYDVPHPVVSGVRVISLNTAFFSYRYQPASFSQGCAPVASKADNDLLAWLASSLAAAKQAHEKVWLLFHVPPGIDVSATMHEYESLAKEGPSPAVAMCQQAIVPLWNPEWTSQFDSLLENYQDTDHSKLCRTYSHRRLQTNRQTRFQRKIRAH